MPTPIISQLDELDPVRCPCGWARRAFGFPGNQVATLHLVEIDGAAQLHYHQRTTELYLILEGEGIVELDGKQVAVKPLTALLIPPGCRHRAIGRLRLINIPVPAFDPADEFVVEAMPEAAGA